MNSKPLTYNCLESVIKHTDLNKRLQLKARCSSIKQLESNVPLEIDTLDFYGDHLVVNGTEYRIGVIQKWPNSQVPNYAKLELMNGGCFNDLNEFGARCSDESVDLMPGDIDMMKKRPRYKDPRIIPNPVDIDIAEKEENIKFYKKELEKLRSVWGTTIFSFDELKEFKKKNDIFYDKHYANRRGYSANNKEQEALDVQKKLILNIFREKRKLQCSINKRDNIHPEFLVLLTMKSPTGEKRVEYGKYTGKLHDSQKGLLSFILGDRSCSVNVKKLILSNESVIRVPIGLKLKIQELEIISDYDLTRFEVLFNKLKPILDESSIPLRSLEFRSIRVKDFNHEAVRTAEKLIVKWNGNPRNVLQAYVDLPNRRVVTHIAYPPPEHLLEFIQRWKEVGRAIGTHYSFFVIKQVMSEVFESLRKDAISEGEHFVIIPFNEGSNLKILHAYPDKLIHFEVVDASSE